VNIRHHLITLEALLSVGKRSVRRLADDPTVPPATAIDELVAQAEVVLADLRVDALTSAEQNRSQAVHDTATLKRLQSEQTDLAKLRSDPNGPVAADRLWLSTLVGVVLIGAVVGLGMAVVAKGFEPGRTGDVLMLALTSLIAAITGDWVGRSRGGASLVALLAPMIPIALAVALMTTGSWNDRRSLSAVQVAVILTACCAGFLIGRARRVAPAIREYDRARRLRHELALAEEQASLSSAQVSGLDDLYAGNVDQLGERLLRSVEEYLGSVESERVSGRAPHSGDVSALRERAESTVATWQRTLSDE
jgi:hypothetical protein